MKFTRYSLQLAAVLFCVFLAGCEMPWSKKEATAASKLVIVDLNDADLFNAVHIKDALNVPLAELETKAKDWNKADKYVIYCSNPLCTASETAAESLKKLGFETVRHLKGGIAAWHKMWSKDQPQLLVVDEAKMTDAFKKMLDVELTDEIKAAAEELKKEIETVVAPVAEVKVEEVKTEVVPAPAVEAAAPAPAAAPAVATESAPLSDTK